MGPPADPAGAAQGGAQRLGERGAHEQAEGEGKYKVDSTPTFVFNGRSVPGAISFDTFAGNVSEAAAKA